MINSFKPVYLLLCVYLCLFGCGEEHLQSVLYDVGSGPVVVETELPPVVWDTLKVVRERNLQTLQLVSGNPNAAGMIAEETARVAELKAWQEAYYDRFVDAGGIAIVGNSGIGDAHYIRAGQIVLSMTAKRPEVRERLSVGNGFYMVLVGGEDTTGWGYPPEVRHTAIRIGYVPPPGCSQDSRGGYCQGWVLEHRVGRVFDNFVHEFAHAMDYSIITRLDPDFYDQVKQAYETALVSGAWAGLYAEAAPGEYWAEGTVVWFYDIGPGRLFETYAALAEHDPLLFDLLDAWFPRVSFAGRY